MKKSIIIIALMAFSFAVTAQVKKDTSKVASIFGGSVFTGKVSNPVLYSLFRNSTSFVATKWVFLAGHDSAVVTITPPDSAGMYTVKFAKSQVTFLNDSTFTFKIQKLK